MASEHGRPPGDDPELASEGELRLNDYPELARNRERLAGGDRDLAGADRDPSDVKAVSRLERRARRLLRLYPAAYRRERCEEIIGTLLEATPDGATWPRLRDVRALGVGGLKARATQNRQRTVGANLRVAVMAGLAMYLSYWVAVYLNVVLQQFMPKSVRIPGPAFGASGAAAVLLGTTIVLAWTAPRRAALSAALAASAGLVTYTLVVIGGPTAMVGPRLLQVLALIGLAALAPQPGHPSRHWLWLPGVIAACVLLALQGWPDISLNLGFLSPWLPLVAIAACGVVWVCVDARLIVTVLTFLAVSALQMPMMDISSGFWDLPSLAFLGVVLALGAPAVWLLRRQSARPAQVAS